MIDLRRLAGSTLESEPFRWGEIGGLYAESDARRLASSYPFDHYKLVSGYGGEKDYEYEARQLIPMGQRAIAHRESLSEEWRALAADLLSPEYREAIATLSGCDLRKALLEVNVFHYGPGASLGPHTDLPEKLVTHVLYFNDGWNRADGGCLNILRGKDPASVHAEIAPHVGNSAVLVRSDRSWHSVSRVVSQCATSRRSLTATFYRRGSVSSMWPRGDKTVLRDYRESAGAVAREMR